MRVVLDTNVLVSALLVESSPPAQLITHWRLLALGRYAGIKIASVRDFMTLAGLLP